MIITIIILKSSHGIFKLLKMKEKVLKGQPEGGKKDIIFKVIKMRITADFLFKSTKARMKTI